MIITEDMKKLYSILISKQSGNQKYFIALEGPPGTGKTTTAIWLYCQIRRNVKAICIPSLLTTETLQEVKGILQKIPEEEIVYLFADFHDINLFSSTNWSCWASLFTRDKAVMVWGLSSGFHLARVLGSRQVQSFLSSLYAGFSKYIIHKQEDEVMLKIGKEFGLNVSQVSYKEHVVSLGSSQKQPFMIIYQKN